ncbi:hypothetical protein, partial [Gynurincola endophyticus]|uniref:hypothetical protein n=1 Tax=Gynurincola endophyticus TaxID=2479004 RepID=UPI001F2F0910
HYQYLKNYPTFSKAERKDRKHDSFLPNYFVLFFKLFALLSLSASFDFFRTFAGKGLYSYNGKSLFFIYFNVDFSCLIHFTHSFKVYIIEKVALEKATLRF